MYDKSISSAELTTYKSRLVSNVNNNWGIAGDGHEKSGYVRLNGHPTGEIWHWFAIRGYLNWGDTTNYVLDLRSGGYTAVTPPWGFGTAGGGHMFVGWVETQAEGTDVDRRSIIDTRTLPPLPGC